ncbi:universal stress protein [Salipiger mucosus]|uniref:Universal stress protein UspA n=1 Tax=Salipiger mucosus DSM 16094 TaxID=1123237 RepID=S9QQL8_9RHOB|nr:universal stress protein [Salipiger mucosus]EPX83686.1 Universal stress protein UspA [Salipiger mucosus DSM 16094]
MKGPIVVATDGSEPGGRAVDCAAEFSAGLGLRLCIVHVLLHGRPRQELARLAGIEELARCANAPEVFGPGGLRYIAHTAEEEIAVGCAIVAIGDEILARARARAEALGAKDIVTRACAGDYADEVLDVAEAEKAGMVVLGSRGLGRLRGTLLGSVSQKVLHHAHCTVVIVR